MLSSSQVQDPQGLRSNSSIHGSSPLSTYGAPPNGKDNLPRYEHYVHQFPGLTSPMPTSAVSEVDSQGRLYSIPLALHSAFRPFYFGIPGTQPGPPPAPLHIPVPSVPSPHQADQYGHASLAQNIPQPAQPPTLPPVNGLHVGPGGQQIGSPQREDSSAYASSYPRSTSKSLQRSASRSSQGAHEYPYRHKDPQLSKRTKVSRACDECRRKKTRCDVDPEHEICTPCSRAGVPCTFARAQLKRGPAKKRLSHGALPLPRIYNSGQNGSAVDTTGSSNVGANAQGTRKSRSVSDVIPKGLRPIETLLGYSNDPSYAVNNSPAASSATSSYTPSSSAPTASGFPMLVEVACRQSESPQQGGAISPKHQSQSPVQTGIAKPQTPPAQYDANAYGVSHNALMEYYTFIHPTFPILPDLVADFNTIICSSPASKEYIVSALNGSSNNVPFGLGNSATSDAVKEAHLIALLFTYLRTLDSAWLGASVAACTAMMTAHGNETLIESRTRLTALVVVFDRLHCAVFDTPSLLPDCLLRVAQACTKLAPILRMLGILPPPAQPEQSEQFLTTPQAALSILGKLGNSIISASEASTQLQPLLPQLQRTPLEQFVNVLSNRVNRN